MRKFVNTTTEIPEDVLQNLKEKSGEKSSKEALFKAISHYLYCPYSQDEDKTGIGHSTEHGETKRKLSGRKPVYISKIQEKL